MGLAVRKLSNLTYLGSLRSCGSLRGLGYLICLIMPGPAMGPLVLTTMDGRVIVIIIILIIGAR